MGNEYLTMAEIKAKYPNEWVLLHDLKCRRKWGELLGGRVVWHSPDRNEFDRRLAEFPNAPEEAFHYTGEHTAGWDWEEYE